MVLLGSGSGSGCHTVGVAAFCFWFWVWVPRCRGGGLLLLVLGDWPSARVARCRSDVGFFYIRHRGWFFWVRILGLGATL